MFTSDVKGMAIDSISAVEGTFKVHPDTGEAEISVLMMYSHQETHLTLGTCPVKESVLSDKTKEFLMQFLQSAEEDFGKVVFDSGALVSRQSSPGIESSDGLRAKGMGEGWPP